MTHNPTYRDVGLLIQLTGMLIQVTEKSFLIQLIGRLTSNSTYRDVKSLASTAHIDGEPHVEKGVAHTANQHHVAVAFRQTLRKLGHHTHDCWWCSHTSVKI